MSPPIALIATLLWILGLFFLERDQRSRTSKTLWLSVVWLSLAGSRTVSVWLSDLGFLTSGPRAAVEDAYLEGSPIDRAVLSVLLLVGIIVLIRRRHKLRKLLGSTGPIVLYLSYGAMSIVWSDYSGIAFKRWTKAVADLTMVLLVLTDYDPSAAVKRLLARTGFILMPLSLLFIKYYPELGRRYTRWEGTLLNTGVTTNKNELGMICLVLGLGSLWRLLQEIGAGKRASRAGPRIAHAANLSLVVWLLWLAKSSTSTSCFFLAGSLMVLVSLTALPQKPALLHLLIATALAVPVFAIFADSSGSLLAAVGRNPTLTGRTGIWSAVIALNPNPVLGAGFESFWLGPRLQKLWSMFPNLNVNEAHNGYIDVYLSLGWVGVVLLLVLLVTGYQKVVHAVRQDPKAASLKLAYFVAAVIYNLSESSFKIMHPVWFFLLWATIAPPRWKHGHKTAAHQNSIQRCCETVDPVLTITA